MKGCFLVFLRRFRNNFKIYEIMKNYTITYLDSNNNTLEDSYYTDCIFKAEKLFWIRNKDIKQVLSIK